MSALRPISVLPNQVGGTQSCRWSFLMSRTIRMVRRSQVRDPPDDRLWAVFALESFFDCTICDILARFIG